MPSYSYGPGGGPVIPIPGAPAAGSDTVQTLTIGGTPTGGTFQLVLGGLPTGNITWVNVNATLLTAINTALNARFGAGAIIATAGSLTAGVGTILLTFSGAGYAKGPVSAMTVTNALTGTSPTLAVAVTTPGVEGTLVGAPPGTMCVNTVAGTVFCNTGTSTSPVWTAQV